jgi:hypothetical protein
MGYEGVSGGLLGGDADGGDVGAEEGALVLLPYLLPLLLRHDRRLLLLLAGVGSGLLCKRRIINNNRFNY